MLRKYKIECICKKLNIDKDALPNRLDSTLLKAIATSCGCASDFQNNLYSTFLRSACIRKGIDCDCDEMHLYGHLIDALYEKICGEEPYVPVVPLDEDKFPQTLNGFYAELLTGLASGASSSYNGSVFAKPWISQPAKKLGKCYSSWGNGVDNFSKYKFGKIAIGYSADSKTAGTQAFNVWWQDLKTGKADVNAVNAEIDAADITILYELFTDDGSVWNAVQRKADDVYGYYNEATDTFVEVKDMMLPPSNDFVMFGNPFDGEPERGE